MNVTAAALPTKEWDGEPLEPETPGMQPLRPPVEGVEKEGEEENQQRQKIKIRLKDGKDREIQHMMSISFWSAAGKPVTAEEFPEDLFGALPQFFTSDAELRTLWSNPLTRKTLLQNLAAAGYGKDELLTLQKIVDAEKSYLFDVLEYISFAVKQITRELCVAHAARNIFALLTDVQQELIRFVLAKHVECGV